jgi:glyoxalase-like protein
MELDHVLIAVDDLDAAAQEVERRHGLVSVEGGRHQGLGTANRIVPLGETYLELVAVVDEAEAAESGFGSWVAGGALPRLLGWCVRTDELDEVAGRLKLTITDGARARPEGTMLRWRIAGLERSAEEPSLPFFIEWGAGTPYPGRVLDQTATIHELRLSVGEGSPELRSVLVDETVIDPSLWA